MSYKVTHTDNRVEIVNTLEEAKNAGGVRYERHFEKGDAIKNEPPKPLDQLAGHALTNEMFMASVSKEAEKTRKKYESDYRTFVTMYEAGYAFEDIALKLEKSIVTLKGNKYWRRYLNRNKR